MLFNLFFWKKLQVKAQLEAGSTTAALLATFLIAASRCLPSRLAWQGCQLHTWSHIPTPVTLE